MDLGDSTSSTQFVTENVQKWVSSVCYLSEIAVSQPLDNLCDLHSTLNVQLATLLKYLNFITQFSFEYQV